MSVTAHVYQVPVTGQALLSEPDARNFIESLKQFYRSDVINTPINKGK